MILFDLVALRNKVAVIILLLLSVIVIFVSPAVDLQPTALRALKFANVLFAALLLAGTALWAHLRVASEPITPIDKRHSVLSPPPDLLELNCARLC